MERLMNSIYRTRSFKVTLKRRVPSEAFIVIKYRYSRYHMHDVKKNIYSQLYYNKALNASFNTYVMLLFLLREKELNILAKKYFFEKRNLFTCQFVYLFTKLVCEKPIILYAL